MTVGLVYNNLERGVVITDGRVSIGPRESDSLEKFAIFTGKPAEGKPYSGVVFGAGLADDVEMVLQKAGHSVLTLSLEEYVNQVFSDLSRRARERANKFVESYTTDTDTKAELIRDAGEKRRFISSRISEGMGQIDEGNQRYAANTIIVACEGNQLRKFTIRTRGSLELFHPHTEIGSGADGANWYFTNETQGVPVTKLSINELLFYAANAYVYATANIGVGGTPRIAFLKAKAKDEKGKVKVLDAFKSAAISNICGAYQAEIIDRKTIEAYINYILTHGAYEDIAEKLGLTVVSLTAAMIPKSTWVQRANAERYR